MAANVKIGVDLGQFNQGIKQGTQILKGLNAEMKASEAEFKATGNAEKKLESQTKTLNSQIQTQKDIIKNAQAALDRMKAQGIDPADQAYQKMYLTLMNAQAGMNEAQASLNALGSGAAQAAAGADQLTKSVNGIGKKISLDQVIGGIDKITSGLENAAKKAVSLGEELWNVIMDSAKRADDTATMAQMYGIDLETFQKMQKMVDNGMDTTVEAILKAQDKLKKGIGNKSLADELNDLGISTNRFIAVWTENGKVMRERTPEDLFWQAGKALMNLGSKYDKETKAQAIFGRSWKELVPLFEKYDSLEAYQEALKELTVNDEDTIRDLAALNDAVGALESSWTTLKDELIGSIAPALTAGAEAVGGLLNSLTEYLKTEDGQKMLENLGTAVSGLFDDLGKIDPEQVISGFTGVLEQVVSGVEWLVNNKDGVVTALEAIGAGFLALKVTDDILTVIKVIAGIKGITIGGGAAAGAGATAATGGGWFSGIMAGIGEKAAGLNVGNASFVYDWLTHNSPIASLFQGTETVGQLWERLKQEQQQRTETFAENWDPNSENANVIAQGIGEIGKVYDNQIQYWTQRFQEWKMMEDAVEQDKPAPEERKLNLSDYSDWVVPEDWSIEEITQAVKEATGGEDVPIDTEPKVVDGAAASVSEQIGNVPVTVYPVYSEDDRGYPRSYANGLPFVPYDGYLSVLHRGERVLTASQNRSYTYNSNNYFGNVNLNNGQDIENLCDSIDRHNRRQRTGYGS